MKYPLLVTAAIIEDSGKFLITQRKSEAHNGDRWEFPGGKVEFGEDPKQGLVREIKEELDVEIVPGDLLEYSSHVYNEERHIILLGIYCKFISGNIQKKQIQDFRWVTLEEMDKYDITEADLPFVEKLKEIRSKNK